MKIEIIRTGRISRVVPKMLFEKNQTSLQIKTFLIKKISRGANFN
jgi:hypothetical protein